MDSGQTAYIICRLVFGAAAAFLAIMLWSKTRDAAWMLIIMGAIFAYIEIIYSVLGLFGIDGSNLFLIGSVPLISFVLPLLRMIFFIAAFIVMIVRHSRQN
jgi:membrane-bound ClpP family serine protease